MYRAINDEDAILLHRGAQRHSATGPQALVCVDDEEGFYEVRDLFGPGYDEIETRENVALQAAKDLWPHERLVAIF